jgi:Domain of unknown function (DUF4376)
MIQAFLVDEATGVTVQRLGVPDLATLERYALEPGQQIVPFLFAADIEAFETYRGESGATYVRPRAVNLARELEVAKISRRAEVLSRRDRAEWGGCAGPLGRVDSDPDSQRKISGAVQMAMIAQAAGQPFAVDWTMQDNSTVTHDAVAMIGIGLAVGQHVAACHERGLALKAQIEEAADQDALSAIDINAGWPS